MDSRVINTGQVRNCAERVYVQESIKDAFISRLTQAFKQVTFGNHAEQDGGWIWARSLMKSP